MIQVNIQEDLRALDRLTSQLSNSAVAAATSRAINRALSNARSKVIKQQIKDKYNIKPSDMAGIDLFNATRAKPTGKIGMSRKPISLTKFNPVFYNVTSSGVSKTTVKGKALNKITRKVRRAEAKGVSVEIMKGKRVNVPYAFMLSGNAAKPVFARGRYEGGGGSYNFVARNKRVNKSGSDTPITKLMTTSLYGAMQNSTVAGRVETNVSEFFVKRMQQELNYEISKI